MNNKFIAAAILLVLVLQACSPVRMALSNELRPATELEVKGRNGLLINQKLAFGEYRTEKINRSWTEGNSVNGGAMKVLWTTYSQKKQSIHFSLNDSAAHRAEVFCLAKTHAEDWTVGENPNSIVNIMADVLGMGVRSDNTFAVNIYLPREPEPWQMMVDMEAVQRHSKRYVGYLARSKNDYYTVHPVTGIEQQGKIRNLPMGSVGFEIRNQSGSAVAAVSLIDKGKVYLGTTQPEERFLIANACAALLLHEVID